VHGLLRHGEITSCEAIPWGSNYTFCVELQFDDTRSVGVYKPRRGERPLWDFPDGTLYLREYAAFLASQAMGWSFIPPTVIRQGPFGVGSVQLYVESEATRSVREIIESPDPMLARFAAFDIVTNNADRKAGHILRGPNGQLWGIDHGLCFNVDPKVRTVLQHFCGQPVPHQVLEELSAFRQDRSRVHGLVQCLRPLIAEEEIAVFLRRVDWLLTQRLFPGLSGYRSVPWPPF
jgi:hypothetical protein